MKRTALVATATTLLASVAVSAGVVGTAHAASADLKISELRLRGPGGANDEFVEIANPTGAAVTVGVDDGSAGWSLVASDGTARFTIPNGTVIPAGGHYLGVNSVGYTLATYPAGNGTTATGDATYSTDIPDNAGIALFRTSNPANFTLANRSDAVGSTAEANATYREGAGYGPLLVQGINASLFRNAISGAIADTDDNATDFRFGDPNGTSDGAGQHLAAPGPENLSSPVNLNGSVAVSLVDPGAGPFAAPNMVRDFTSVPAQNSTFGTVELRRKITNNSGANITRLRVRAARVETFPAPSGKADLRGRTSADNGSIPLTGGGTTSASGTTVEVPPNQPNGSGDNATMSVPGITVGTPLAPGASVNVILYFGIQQTGLFDNFFNVEGLVTGLPGTSGASFELKCGTDGCGTAPVAVADGYATPEDVPLNVVLPGVLSNDSDVDGDTIHAVLDTNGAHGTAVLSANGSFLYTPNANYHGPDSFTYHANDGGLDGNVVAVDVNVTAVNDAPVAVADGYSTAEDVPLTVPAGTGVLANDSDADGDTFNAVIDVNAAHGSVALAGDGGFTYTPNANYHGPDSFTYHANDGSADGNIVVVTLDVTPANDAPVAADDGYNTAEDTPLTVLAATGVLANDSDADPGSTLTAAIDTNGAHGTAVLAADGSFTYTPDADYNGPDSFTYHANDGTADGNIATVSITVGPVNDAPVAVADSRNAVEDTPLVVTAPGVLGNDTDPDGDPITAVLDANALHGSVVLGADGSFTYTPNENYNGPDSFTYHANDGALDSNIVAVTLDVAAVNDAPVAGADAYGGIEDTTLTVAAGSGVLVNDTDVEGDALSAVLDTATAHGTIALAPDGSFVYHPGADFNGVDSFTYHAFDGAADSSIVTVTITLAPVNDAPVADPDGYAGTEDTVLSVSAAGGVLGDDVDVDGNPIVAVLDTSTTRGVLVLNADGSFTYTPSLNVNGIDSFTYHASDGALNSNVVTVTLNIAAVNDAPTAGVDIADSNIDGSPVTIDVLGNDGDLDGDTVTIVASTDGEKGGVVCSATSCTYTPYSNQDGTDSFTYTLSDGHGATVLGTVNIRSLAQQIFQGPVTTVPYTAPQSGPLPSTGANTLLLALVGLALTGAGAMVLRSRRLVGRTD